jgi:hypothetical protein
MSEHTHAFSAWPFADAVDTGSFSTAKVVHHGFPVLRVSHDAEGDWQFLDATTEEPGECVLLCLGCIYERDATLGQISDLPRGWSAYRPEIGAAWERWEQPHHEECDEGDEKALADIEAYGLHIINVREEGDSPPFSYSIGIEKTLGMPELIVIGLKPGVGQSVINECYARMKSGTRLDPGSRFAGLLGGDFICLIGDVSPDQFKEYMGWALWLYEGPNFRAHQIIFPSTAGAFPWEPEASEWFRGWQPLLGEQNIAHAERHADLLPG